MTLLLEAINCEMADQRSVALLSSRWNSARNRIRMTTFRNPHSLDFLESDTKWDRWDSNPEPKDYESDGDELENKQRQRVTKRRSRRCTTGCTSEREIERGEVVGGSVSSRAESLPIKADSFSAALALIASLPLSDAEKADAVRRLMWEQAGSPEKSHGGSHAIR